MDSFIVHIRTGSIRELTCLWKVCTLFKHGAMEGNDLSCFLISCANSWVSSKLRLHGAPESRTNNDEVGLWTGKFGPEELADRRAAGRAARHVFTLLEPFRDTFWLLQQQQQQDPEWLVETSHGPVTVFKVYRRVSEPQIFSDTFRRYEPLPRKCSLKYFIYYSILSWVL